jgi:hypothetical protein
METIRFEPGKTYTGRLRGGIDSDLTITVMDRGRDGETIILEGGQEVTPGVYNGSECIRRWRDDGTKPVFYAQEQDADSEKEHWNILEPRLWDPDVYRCARAYTVGGGGD